MYGSKTTFTRCLSIFMFLWTSCRTVVGVCLLLKPAKPITQCSVLVTAYTKYKLNSVHLAVGIFTKLIFFCFILNLSSFQTFKLIFLKIFWNTFLLFRFLLFYIFNINWIFKKKIIKSVENFFKSSFSNSVEFWYCYWHNSV